VQDWQLTFIPLFNRLCLKSEKIGVNKEIEFISTRNLIAWIKVIKKLNKTAQLT